jgi:hypothetical protein
MQPIIVQASEEQSSPVTFSMDNNCTLPTSEGSDDRCCHVEFSIESLSLLFEILFIASIENVVVKVWAGPWGNVWDRGERTKDRIEDGNWNFETAFLFCYGY